MVDSFIASPPGKPFFSQPQALQRLRLFFTN
jgi:hypothetical protein